jgi:hypothetical protein
MITTIKGKEIEIGAITADFANEAAYVHYRQVYDKEAGIYSDWVVNPFMRNWVEYVEVEDLSKPHGFRTEEIPHRDFDAYQKLSSANAMKKALAHVESELK